MLAGSMRLIVCALGMTAVAARAEGVNDYPTAARSEYVFGCLKANGETRQRKTQDKAGAEAKAGVVGRLCPPGGKEGVAEDSREAA